MNGGLGIGMNVAAGPELAAAVTNAGGVGVIGGLGYTPKLLRHQVRDIPTFSLKQSKLITTCTRFKKSRRI